LGTRVRRRIFGGALSTESNTNVVDHDLRALRGQAKSDGSPDSPASAGHYRHATF